MQYLLHHMLDNSAQRRPDREALVCREQRLDFANTVERVASLAGELHNLGIARGDRVAICLPPSSALAIAIFAVSKAGGAFVPIYHGLFSDQVAHILRDSGAKALITDSGRWQESEKILENVDDLQFALVRGAVVSDATRPVYDFDALCLNRSPAKHQERCLDRDLAAIIYTSGSTGLPKGVMLSHGNLRAGAEIVSDYLGITECDRLLAVLPFSFDAGLNQLTSAVFKASAAVITEFTFGRDIVTKLHDESITGLAGVPSLWSMLTQRSSGLGNRPLPNLRYVTNTGGSMPRSVLARMRQLLPDTDVFLMYGLTEAFRSTYLPPDELDRRPNSIGKAIPNTEIFVVDEEGRPCATGEIGELVHDGPTVSLGYWQCPELTAKVLRPHPSPRPGRPDTDRVCYSGDLVRKDQEGFLYFVGRRDHQIKSAGFRVSPTEVEQVICRQSNVSQAAVVGAPDSVLGQQIIAFVVPEEGMNPSVEDILANCASHLPRYMVPKTVIYLQNLPTTSSGKVDYCKLREEVCAPDVAAK